MFGRGGWLAAGMFALAWATSGPRAQGPDGGAVLRNPLDPTSSAPLAPTKGAPAVPDYVKSLIQGNGPASSVGDPLTPSRLHDALKDEGPDINHDCQVTPNVGPWLLYVMSYQGPSGPLQARKFVQELRTKYRAPAYVFYYGADERRKERERVRKLLDQQTKFFAENKLTLDEPLRVRFQNIDVQYAVLIAGYSSADAARKALEQIRKWPAPDPKQVDLDTMFYQKNKDEKVERAERIYVNPFTRAFVCRNPTVKDETKQEDPKKLDVQALRRLNEDEPLSLFRCPKPYTLAVKDFQTPFMMHDKNTPESAWDLFGPKQKTDRVDGAARSAHNLAEAFRKSGKEAYVLHSKYSSVVTIGAYDSPDDPALKAEQEQLARKLHTGGGLQIQFMHRPVVMQVPR